MNSELGVGTCFEVYLPVFDGMPEQSEPDPPESIPTQGNERLLLVEDDPSVRTVLTEYLEEHGYKVIPAEDGEAGLELARQNGPSLDLVLTDVVMPKMSGVELARTLRVESPHVKILLISGHAKDRKGVVEESLKCSSCSFLQKPFTPQVLVTRIRELLDG